MHTFGYLAAAVFSITLLGIAAGCAGAAGRNHLSPWWVPAYASLLGGFVLVAIGTAPLRA